MNGHKGRARALRRIARNRINEAKAAGVDVSDRKAVEDFHASQWNAMVDRVFASKTEAERAAMKRHA